MGGTASKPSDEEILFLKENPEIFNFLKYKGVINKSGQKIPGKSPTELTVEESEQFDNEVLVNLVKLGYIHKYDMGSLQKIRLHKDKKYLAFKPSKAYWLRGHGTEPINVNDTFIVPPGCIIVAKAQVGEAIFVSHYIKYIQKFCESDTNKNIMKDPIKNIDDLIKMFGSVAIYKPGDKCPQFSYQLVNCEIAKNSIARCGNYGSGVLDLDNDIHCDISSKSLTDLNYESIVPYITSLYESSIYPKMNDVLNRIKTIQNFDSKTPIQPALAIAAAISGSEEALSPRDDKARAAALTIINNDIFMINQEALCKKLGTGVYYNFICRSRFHTTIYTDEVVPLTNKTYRLHRIVHGKENLREKDNFIKKLNIKLLQDRIIEAQKIRAPLLAKHYTSTYRIPNDYNEFLSIDGPNAAPPPVRNAPPVPINYRNYIKQQQEQAINNIAKRAAIRKAPVPINYRNYLKRQQQQEHNNKFIKYDSQPYYLVLLITNPTIYSDEMILTAINEITNTEFPQTSLLNSPWKFISSSDDIINYKNELGFTPLFLAIMTKRNKLIGPLIKAGAKTDILINGGSIFDNITQLVNNDPSYMETALAYYIATNPKKGGKRTRKNSKKYTSY
jgi:hypothetical protein